MEFSSKLKCNFPPLSHCTTTSSSLTTSLHIAYVGNRRGFFAWTSMNSNMKWWYLGDGCLHVSKSSGCKTCYFWRRVHKELLICMCNHEDLSVPNACMPPNISVFGIFFFGHRKAEEEQELQVEGLFSREAGAHVTSRHERSTKLKLPKFRKLTSVPDKTHCDDCSHKKVDCGSDLGSLCSDHFVHIAMTLDVNYLRGSMAVFFWLFQPIPPLLSDFCLVQLRVFPFLHCSCHLQECTFYWQIPLCVCVCVGRILHELLL